MIGFRAALWAESLKARRSRVLLGVGLGFMMLPFVGALFMVILKDPDQARNMGLISAKAQLTAGTADWPAYLGMMAQGTGIGGIMLFSIAASWLFGREFADRTAKDWLALPTSRSAVVSAKLVILCGWVLALAVMACALCLALGSLIVLPLWSSELIRQGLLTVLGTTILTLCLITPIVLAASAGRGYLAPMGCALLAVFLAQIIAATGWGAYFPYSVPALFSGLGRPVGEPMGAISFVIVVLTGLAGIAGTLLWWQRADQTV